MASREQNEAPLKKPYQAPRLRLFGRLKDLTTGGTGNANESSSGLKPRP